MEDYFESKLNILLELLEKKEEALTQILSISENQSTVLESDDAEGMSFFREMNIEKQKRIDEVLDNDKAFQSLFVKLSDDFERKGPSFTKKIKRLQDKIKAVIELDIRIRVCENKNRELSQKANPNASIQAQQAPRISRNKLLTQYKNNSKK